MGYARKIVDSGVEEKPALTIVHRKKVKAAPEASEIQPPAALKYLPQPSKETTSDIGGYWKRTVGAKTGTEGEEALRMTVDARELQIISKLEKALRSTEFKWTDHPSFHEKEAKNIIPEAFALVHERRGKTTTLKTAEEVILFKGLNYASKFIHDMLQGHPTRLGVRNLDCIRAALLCASLCRNQLMESNIPLVLAMAKRCKFNFQDFDEAISEGNLAVLRSIDKFDFGRGFKFSTYACRSILKSFSRVAQKISNRARHEISAADHTESSTPDPKAKDPADAFLKDESSDLFTSVSTARSRELNGIEQTVIKHRFFPKEVDPAHEKPFTLEEVGLAIGVTKERVRQIQNKALAKLKVALSESETDTFHQISQAG